MTFDLTSAAVEDLQSIREYTLRKWGAEQEEKYLDAMWKRVEEIQADPERWKFRNDLFPGCQLAAQGKHVIVFRMDDEVIQVVRILHSAMDFRLHLPSEE